MHPLPQTISLHIGAHKTASSHLQNVLYQNRALLKEHSIRLYGPKYLRMSGRNLAAMFDLSWSTNPAPRRKPLRQLKFLAKGRKHLVLSEENFVGNLADQKGRTALPLYPTAAERIGELLGKWAPVKTEVFLAVRDPASFMASAYSQAMFGGNHIRPRQFRMRNDWHDVDWADYVQRLTQVPDIGHIYVWRQEDYQDAFREILCRMLRWDDASAIETIDGRVHRGLSMTAVQKTLEAASAGETGTLARDARRAYPVGDDYKQFQLYSSSTLRKAADIYAVQMAKIEQMSGVTVIRPPAKPKQG